LGTFKGAAEAGLVGGATAGITGGRFDDGFTVSAAGYLFNSAADEARKALQDSQARHEAAVAQEVQILKENYRIVGTEMYAENPELLPYVRRYDIVVEDQDTGTVFGVEVKTTSTGVYRLDPRQVPFDVATVQGDSGLGPRTTLLSDGTPVNGVMYRGVDFSGKVEAVISTLTLARQLNEQNIPWHYSGHPSGQ
jgi:hypothetical protein